MADTGRKYLCLEFRVDIAAEDAFLAEMSSIATLGLERQDAPSGAVRYLAYFGRALETSAQEVVAGIQALKGVDLIGTRGIAERDWLEPYRRKSRPFALGRHWWVDPREPGSPEEGIPTDRRLLRIPAWRAFGTGSHMSTALLVRLLEKVPLGAKRVLDVGTGTGILAMVALDRGATGVTALDIDPIATIVALQTCRLNGFHPHLVAGGIDSLQDGGTDGLFDVVIANVIPSLLRPDLARIVAVARPRARILLSGILADQEEPFLCELAALGLQHLASLQDEGWVALQLEKKEA